MIDRVGIGNLRNLLTSQKVSGKLLQLSPGTIVKAQVIETHDKNNVTLRLITPNSYSGNPQGITLDAHSDIPLTQGQTIFLEILSGKNNITLRFIGDSKNSAESAQNKVPAKFLELLSQLTNSRLQSSEFQQLLTILKSLPHSIKERIPELQNVEKFFIDVKHLDGKVLKAFIESSGIASESRLKLAVMNNPGSIIQSIIALQKDGDLKTLLIRLKNLLKDQNTIAIVKQSGHGMQDIENTIEKCIRHIEFYQLTSKINDMFYTFLPVIWDDIKDGEFLFRKNSEEIDTYSCDINLEFESLGRLSVSLKLLNKGFYITFFTEEEPFQQLLESNRHILENKFSSQGLLIKALNVRYKKHIAFGKLQNNKVDMKI